ncbi:MAG: hypothetical protein WBH24_00180, partial [Candidatus Acidiferrum sp.]
HYPERPSRDKKIDSGTSPQEYLNLSLSGNIARSGRFEFVDTRWAAFRGGVNQAITSMKFWEGQNDAERRD